MWVRDERGAITVEACISVTVFMLIMLFMSSIFVMFRAQHETAHVLLETSQSLSVDAYAASKLGTGNPDLEKVGDGEYTLKDVQVAIGSFLSEKMGNEKHPQYATNETDWFDGKKTHKEALKKRLKERFLAYLGDSEDEADKILKELHVENGKEGLDFSESHVANGVLYVTLRYQFEEDFMVMGMKPPEVVQTAQSKLWQ